MWLIACLLSFLSISSTQYYMSKRLLQTNNHSNKKQTNKQAINPGWVKKTTAASRLQLPPGWNAFTGKRHSRISPSFGSSVKFTVATCYCKNLAVYPHCSCRSHTAQSGHIWCHSPKGMYEPSHYAIKLQNPQNIELYEIKIDQIL